MEYNKELNIVTVVQARMNSTRLPYKVMMNILDKPLLLRQIERISLSKETGTIVVATSDELSDDPIVDLCNKENINVLEAIPKIY